jgi:alkylation response protein AidB-like acyl-CoA dehydrogenase
MGRLEAARATLARWEAAKPANFYDDDAHLRLALARRLGAERLARLEPALRRAGADSAGPVSRAAAGLDRPESLPRLERWSAAGERVEEVVFHPDHHAIGRLVWRSGVLGVLAEPGHMTEHAALAYLFALNGEVPHLCSIACTAGLVKAIQRGGDARMRAAWLPRLVETDYDRRWHGAQFLTEVQGGSDVGANACVARPWPDEPGVWRLDGEKWFCSNVSADLWAVSARPEGAAEGSAGLGLFVVPRRLDDGRPNGVFVRRLKNKLGTRTLPTAEVDFTGARAWPVGRLEDGFRLMMGVVINTSRLEVAIGASAMMRRAFVEAFHYARAREAFGRRLRDFPAVRQQLAETRALAAGALAFTLFVTAREDALARAGSAPEDDPLFRVAVTLAKYAASVDAGLAVHHAIEILGGNGTIEDFSPLPRLYREAPVQESWEGPHNTLVAQLLRDAARSKMHAALLAAAEDTLLGVRTPALAPTREGALAALDETGDELDDLLRGDPELAALHARAVFGRIARVMQVALLLEDAQADAGATVPWLPAAAEWLLRRHLTVGWRATRDAGYPDLVARLAGE